MRVVWRGEDTVALCILCYFLPISQGFNLAMSCLSTAHHVQPLWSHQSTLMMRMGCLKNCSRKVQSTTSECCFQNTLNCTRLFLTLWVWGVLLTVCKALEFISVFIFFFHSGNESNIHALLSRGHLSLNTRLAGKLFMRWRSSKESRWTRTLKRPKRNWRLSWIRPNMNISSC